MDKNVLYFREIDRTHLPYVGGKGANLGEMTKAGFPVPQGFCITTRAYRSFIQTSKEMNELLDLLDRVSHEDLEQIRILGQRTREHLLSIPMPDNIKSDILEAWKATGVDNAYAVRSSATAEDLPTASFAGQQETYLNVRGQEQLLQAVQNCWASLFTDRAISYRAKNGFNYRSVFLSAVVQHMVFPEVSGIMFTADPITGRRKTVSIDASFGLGEALVSGLVSADLYQVRSDEVVKKQISKKKLAIYSIPEGGTVTKELPAEKQELQALPDDRIIQLAGLGQKIEAHYGTEQDIEWAFADGKFYILQSRPITSLYPVPHVPDNDLHIFMSFGHPQMMTDAMKPLGISVIRTLIFLGKTGSVRSESRFLLEAGGRLFADFTGVLPLKPVRKRLLKVMDGMDELIASAVREVINRSDLYLPPQPKRRVFRAIRKAAPYLIPIFGRVISNLLFKDPTQAGSYVASFMERGRKECEQELWGTIGADRIRRIQENIGTIALKVFPNVIVYPLAGILAAVQVENRLKKRFGEKQGANLFNRLNKSLPGNVTTEMGLELGDLADTARKYPEVVEYLQRAKDETFCEGLLQVNGGPAFKQEMERFMEKFGMRCPGEIDITNPRWHENPIQLVPSIISNVRSAAPGEHREKFRRGELEAEQAEKEILSQFSFPEKKVMARLIKVYRNLLGLREFHKYLLVIHLDLYKRAILEEGRILAGKGILESEQDVLYFSLEELAALEENRFPGNAREHVELRKKQYEWHQKLTPPRVMTSEGEIITGKLRDVQAPEGALVGTPVSAGVVEGVARVVLRLEEAKLNPGEILVSPYTDPGWTPLFNSAAGLITEVGGMMTHGSVIAREFGIPAVVGIERATEIIRDGARIRVNGTEGYVQVLEK